MEVRTVEGNKGVYTLKLSRRGLRISQGIDITLLESIRVRDILSTDFVAIKRDTSLGEITRLLQQNDLTDYPVIDDDQTLRGVVSFQDVRSVMMRDDLYSMLIAVDLMQHDPPVVRVDASLLEALNGFTQSEIHHLPVVDNIAQGRLVGIITRSSLMPHRLL